MVREDLRFDATLRTDENDVVPEISSDARERKRGHEVSAGTAAGDEELHE